MTWQHKPSPRVEFTREELEAVLEALGPKGPSDPPGIDAARRKLEESLSFYGGQDALIEEARRMEAERRTERQRTDALLESLRAEFERSLNDGGPK